MNQEKTRLQNLYILDVGHGNCTVVRSEDEVVVIDVGRRSTLLEFLLEQGIEVVDTIYISHADLDHVGALNGLLASKSITIENVVINSDSTKETKTWQGLAYELNEAHNSGKLNSKIGLVSGDSVEIDNIGIHILGPSHYLAIKGVGGKDRYGRTITSNSISAVIRVCVSGQSVAILPGDLDVIGLDELLQNVDEAELEAPVIVFPHHGGRPGVGDSQLFVEKLMSTVSPSLVVFSTGRGTPTLPNPDIVRTLRQVAPDARIVCTQLSKHCSISDVTGTFKHLSSVYSQGRENQTCCGGTVVVPLDSNGEIEPNHDHHVRFIRTKVQTPLCRSYGNGS